MGNSTWSGSGVALHALVRLLQFLGFNDFKLAITKLPFWVAFTCTNRPSGARISWFFSPSGNRSRPNTVDTIASPMSPINFPSKLNGHSGKASARMFCAEYNVCSASEMGVGLWCFIFLRNSFISRTVEGASLDSSVQSVNVEQGTFVCRSAIKPHSFASLNSQSE